jgi:hypothetical protein
LWVDRESNDRRVLPAPVLGADHRRLGVRRCSTDHAALLDMTQRSRRRVTDSVLVAGVALASWSEGRLDCPRRSE